MSSTYPAIVCTENTLSGSPRIDGRRLAVGDVVSIVSDSLDYALADYELTLDQIQQALGYCVALQCKRDKPPVFCHNCSLEKPVYIADLEELVGENNSVFVKGENFFFPGSMEELMEDLRGYDWWVIATDLLIDLRNELRDAPTHS